MRKLIVALLSCVALAACAAYAQQQAVTVIGAITAGNCAAFNSNTVIKDAGTTCGGTGGPSNITTAPIITSNAAIGFNNTFPAVISTGGVVQIGPPNVTSGQYLAGPIPSGVTTGPTYRFINQLDLPPINLKITTAAGGVFNILGPISGGTGLSNALPHGLLQTSNPNVPFGVLLASTPGNLVIDQGSTLDWATKTMTGDCTLSSTGAITCTKSSGATFGTFAFQNFATPPTIGGGTPGIINTSQLQVNGNNITLPAAADTVCGVAQNCTWRNTNQFLRIRVQTTVVTSNATAGTPYNINSGGEYFICLFKTTGSASSINLPASPTAGDTYVIKDCKGDDATNPITVNTAGGANTDFIENGAAPYPMSQSTLTFRDIHAFTWSGNTSMGWIFN